MDGFDRKGYPVRDAGRSWLACKASCPCVQEPSHRRPIERKGPYGPFFLHKIKPPTTKL